jgi:hypothetical protein
LAVVTTLYDTSNAYNSDITYYGATAADRPILKIEMDLSSSFPTEVLDIDYGGVLAYNTVTVYDTEDRYDGFVLFDDITNDVQSVEITRGKDARSQVYEYFDAGTCALEMSDFTSKYLPDEPLSPYYPNVTPLRQIRVSADWSGANNVIFRGFVDRWDVQWEPKKQYALVRVTSTDATKLLANFDTEFTGVDGDTAWERVEDMLLDKSWPTDFTDIDTDGYFATLVEDTSDRRPLLPNLQEYQFTEIGALFVSKEGRVTWRNQSAANPNNTETADYTFSDTGVSPNVPVTEIQYGISDDTVYNTVSITATLGTEQVVSNSQSIDTYRERALIRTDVPLDSDASALQLATLLLDKQKDPNARIESVVTDPRLSIHSAGIALTGDILTKVDVVRTPPGGTTTTYKMFVTGIRHQITPETWDTTFITAYRGDILVFISPTPPPTP